MKYEEDKLASSSTMPSINFFLIINTKIPTIVGITISIKGINIIHIKAESYCKKTNTHFCGLRKNGRENRTNI